MKNLPASRPAVVERCTQSVGRRTFRRFAFGSSGPTISPSPSPSSGSSAIAAKPPLRVRSASVATACLPFVARSDGSAASCRKGTGPVSTSLSSVGATSSSVPAMQPLAAPFRRTSIFMRRAAQLKRYLVTTQSICSGLAVLVSAMESVHQGSSGASSHNACSVS